MKESRLKARFASVASLAVRAEAAEERAFDASSSRYRKPIQVPIEYAWAKRSLYSASFLRNSGSVSRPALACAESSETAL